MVPALWRLSARAAAAFFAVVLAIQSSSSSTVVHAAAGAPSSVKSSKGRLPASFLSVLNDLEKEAATAAVSSNTQDDDNDNDNEASLLLTKSSPRIASACLIQSRTLTRLEQNRVRQTLLGLSTNMEEEQDDGEDGSSLLLSMLDHDIKAAGCFTDETDDDDDDNNQAIVCLTLPSSLSELAACTMACRGNLVYVPSSTDLARGEGLLEQLAPAMERVLALMNESDGDNAKLTVVVLDGNLAAAEQQLVAAVEPILSHLVTTSSSSSSTPPPPLSSLSQVFGGGVEFVTLEQAASSVWGGAQQAPPPPIRDATRLSRAVVGVPTTTTSAQQFSPADTLAAQTLALAARGIVEQCVETARQAAQEGGGGGDALVPGFGQVCRAALESAKSEFTKACRSVGGGGNNKILANTAVASQIRQQMMSDLTAQLHGMAARQLELQQAQSLQDYRASLSQLTIGPFLKQAMTEQRQRAQRSFAAAAKQLVPPSSDASALVSAATTQFSRTLQEQGSRRLLKAQASGLFKPLPRKGVTVGLHWLLPKPFGNDYRQEPWKVHTADNLVYTPSHSKLSDVDPNTVESGDWRSQIVPSPVGNDLIYAPQ